MNLNAQTVQSKEEEGRQIVTEVLGKYGVTGITYSEDPYEHYDLSYSGESTIAKVEIKYRIDYDSTQFSTVILQKDKYDYMMAEYEQDKTHMPLYWTVWKDRTSWIVDLSKLSPKWEWKQMRLNNETHTKVFKEVCLIPFNKQKQSDKGKWIIPWIADK